MPLPQTAWQSEGQLYGSSELEQLPSPQIGQSFGQLALLSLPSHAPLPQVEHSTVAPPSQNTPLSWPRQ